MSLQILKNELKADIVRNIYLLYGYEDYLENYYLKRIINKADIKNEDFNVIFQDGKDLTPQNISDTLEVCPLFSEKKIYIITNLPSTNQDALLYLKENLSEVPEHTILIISLEEETLVNYKDVFKELAKVNGLVVEFEKSKEPALCDWVLRQLKSRDHYADNKTIRYMLSICDNKMSSLINEIDKLSNYCINPEITYREIDTVITKTLDAKVFLLTNAILNGEYDKSFTILNSLLKQNFDEINIASSIYNAFIKLYLVKASIKSRVPKSTVMKDLTMKEYPYKLNAVLANKTDEIFIGGCIKLCLEADLLLKQYYIDKKFIIYKLIGDIFLLERKKNA
ncbi:MAG: DNA polymerase III subunit delta [Clostridia bacterium]